MFREIARKKQALPEEACIALLKSEQITGKLVKEA